MYTLLRIEGAREQLERSRDLIARSLPDLSPKVTRRGSLVVDLSNDGDWDTHQREVGRNLGRLAQTLRSLVDAGVAAFADTALYIILPKDDESTGVPVRSYRINRTLIAVLAELELEYEITVYLQSEE